MKNLLDLQTKNDQSLFKKQKKIKKKKEFCIFKNSTITGNQSMVIKIETKTLAEKPATLKQELVENM